MGGYRAIPPAARVDVSRSPACGAVRGRGRRAVSERGGRVPGQSARYFRTAGELMANSADARQVGPSDGSPGNGDKLPNLARIPAQWRHAECSAAVSGVTGEPPGGLEEALCGGLWLWGAAILWDCLSGGISPTVYVSPSLPGSCPRTLPAAGGGSSGE